MDTALLLSHDNSLVCRGCLFDCQTCGRKPRYAVVVVDDGAYCVSCFNCSRCKSRINDLQYARVKGGILCADCCMSRALKRQVQRCFEAARHEQSTLEIGIERIDRPIRVR
jgi:hypothetical protein